MLIKVIVAITIIVALVTYGEMSLDTARQQASLHQASMFGFTPLRVDVADTECDTARALPITAELPSSPELDAGPVQRR